METRYGQVRGLTVAGVRQFKGVPYGASTAGPHRFQRPRPPAPWTGVRDCLGYAPVSPQIPYPVSHEYARLIQFDLNVAVGGMGEDCLHLNIWTPGTERSARRAAIVNIHGGGFAIGSGNHPMYDGAKLAQLGDVVLVSVTHRLASFGYVDLASIDSSERWADAGAAGMLDLVAALEWVRDNIERFGGDPHCVTVLGQSGGGWKVSTLLGMPAARGLFHRAVIQSGSLVAHAPAEVTGGVAQAFIKQLGLTSTTLDRIQDLSWSELLTAQTAIGAHAFAPALDRRHLPAQPAAEAVASWSDQVPLMISTTRDDAGIFFDRFDMTEQELAETLATSFGAKAASLHKTYREHFPARSPYLLYSQLMTDRGFARFAHAQAETRASRQGGAPVYRYLWEWTCPAYDGKFGALHAMDVSASLCNARDGILGSGSRDARLMCDTLSAALLAFAKTGDPNNATIPHWPPFDTSRRATLVVDRHTRIEPDPHGALRRLWADTPMPASVLG